MIINQKYSRHYEEETVINTRAESVFAYADNHTNFSSHMNKSSWMMGGGSMNTHVDNKKFMEIGSHIQMDGNVFGMKLFLDEVITQYKPPHYKEWQTVGDLRLLVIDHYKLGFEIKSGNNNSRFRVFIDYNLPQQAGARLLGSLLGGIYAKWCVSQMLSGVKEHFKSENKEI